MQVFKAYLVLSSSFPDPEQIDTKRGGGISESLETCLVHSTYSEVLPDVAEAFWFMWCILLWKGLKSWGHGLVHLPHCCLISLFSHMELQHYLDSWLPATAWSPAWW